LEMGLNVTERLLGLSDDIWRKRRIDTSKEHQTGSERIEMFGGGEGSPVDQAGQAGRSLPLKVFVLVVHDNDNISTCVHPRLSTIRDVSPVVLRRAC